MTDNPNTRLAGGKYTKERIEQFYELTLTDKQWNLLVDYSANPDEEYETTEDLIFDFIEKRELLEEVSDKYREMWLETHGNPYPLDKDGNDTQAGSK
jgi:hypothetical protein